MEKITIRAKYWPWMRAELIFLQELFNEKKADLFA